MLELLAHLVGDYIIQTNKQAVLKRKSKKQALIHAATYTLPFLLLTRDLRRLVVIFGTHVVIDHWGLARYVVQAKNSLGDWDNREQYKTPTGYPDGTPDWLKTWLLIIADNTMHLVINHLALLNTPDEETEHWTIELKPILPIEQI